MQKNLGKFIFYSFISGIVFGVLLNFFSSSLVPLDKIVFSFLKFGGDLFLKIIKMLVVPIVFFSLIVGVANLKNLSTLGRIGVKTISLYLFTTMLAITLSLTIGYLINPGDGVSILTEKT